MKKKRQHVIPNCYLKAWCDPRTPPGQHPFIWRFSKDGSRSTKRSPDKSFTATDKYTINLPAGERNLIIEDTLASLEGAFVNALKRVRRREKLRLHDRVNLCLFAAAMTTRTESFGLHWKKQLQDLHDLVEGQERAHNAPPITSKITAKYAENAQQFMIAESLQTMSPLFFQMQMAILCTNDPMGFITSDNPCVWFNPKLYKLPPFYRSPGLGQPEIEVTLPLTPLHLLLLSHQQHAQYLQVGTGVVGELNRRARFHCTEEFVSWKGETKQIWFDRGKEPEDTWEKSEEGQRALAQKKLYDECQAKWEAQHATDAEVQERAEISPAEPPNDKD